MKVITIDLDKYTPVSYDINIESFLILYCKYYDRLDYLNLLRVESLADKLMDLEILHFIKITDEMYMSIDGIRTINLECFELRGRSIDLFKEKSVDLDSLAEKMRVLFPAKVRGGAGKPVKSPKMAVVDKLKKFFKYYPNVSEDMILQATSNYVENRRIVNWAYMSQLDYFIFKDNTSMLASEIEEIGEEDEVNQFEVEA